MTNEPTRPGWLSKVAKIEPGEFGAVAASFLLYFCVLGGYFMVRPVRETIGSVLGDAVNRDLFVWTWVVSIAVVPLFGWLASRFRRQTFLPWVYGFVAIALATCGFVFWREGQDQILTGSVFYVMISVLNLLIVSIMWSFLLELFSPSQTKRLFGAIAAGGTTGALVGPWITSKVVGTIHNHGILFLGAGMFVLAIVLQRVLLGIWTRADWRTEGGTPQAERSRPIGGNPFAGVTRVFSSPYLLGIALFVVFLAAVNTFLYFEQQRFIRELYPTARLDASVRELQQQSDASADPAVKARIAQEIVTIRAERTQVLSRRTEVFARIDYVVQSLTVLLQVLATGRLASRWGVGFLLTAVPILMVAGLSTLAAVHTFPVLVAVIITRRVGEYAFVRPGREMLYAPLDSETKYKAKNFIDVPVYRGGDALVAKATEGFATAGSTAVAIGAVVAVAWAVNGWWLGRRREHLQG